MATTATVEKSPLGLDNPMGTDGFEFVEYAAPEPQLLRDLFAKLGFPAVARHRQSDITLHRLRYTMATVLLGRGDLLQAQYRLGHRDASTTLRIYSHVLPLTDREAAATFDQLYP